MFVIEDEIRKAGHELSALDEHQVIIFSILSHAILRPKEYIWTHLNTSITQQQHDLFWSLIHRAKRHVPLAYILGYKEFYNLKFKVTQDTLIPRAESESIVAETVDFIALHPNTTPTIVDVGTGSGCIGISLGKSLPKARIIAIDVSEAALNVAKWNAKQHNVNNITLLHGSLLEPLEGLLEDGQKVDVIVANLPYISDEEFEQLPPNVRLYEPELALKSGSDPDVLNRQLIEQSKHWLRPGGLLLYETTNGEIIEID